MQNNNVPDAGSVLAWGIVALALCSCPVAGLILAIIARNKAKAHAAYYGAPVGKAKVGTIFTRIAFPISIVMQVFWVIYIFVIVFIVANRGEIANWIINY
ncbi:MAG: hypothetical protein II425_03830 [Oscillospiraceae bacterium]|nr:hypothetical protein [Oscillospiraceae bacterium]MBQ2230921.1 hypothetical protein [Oscillospiraceae bacterium]MBQ3987072.1 hypothetical protein [Oscillospiraceae bacterium]MBQ5514230.1 hypothetical protein [Oscillospiraceae bacterium]